MQPSGLSAGARRSAQTNARPRDATITLGRTSLRCGELIASKPPLAHELRSAGLCPDDARARTVRLTPVHLT